jgi:hypothetical protein
MDLYNLGTGKKLIMHVLSSNRIKNWSRIQRENTAQPKKNPYNTKSTPKK